MMVAIRMLRQLIQEDLDQIMAGYTSTEKYVVNKTETPERTTISLQLLAMDRPYVKRWGSDHIEQYSACFRHDLSLGAYVGDRLVGLGLAEPRWWNRTLWIWQFGVLESYWRQGIGLRLMDLLAEKALAANLRVMVAETQNTNVPAIRFYRAAGFAVDAVDLSYYSNHDLSDGEVAIFMKRKLTS